MGGMHGTAFLLPARRLTVSWAPLRRSPHIKSPALPVVSEFIFFDCRPTTRRSMMRTEGTGVNIDLIECLIFK
jgi:hypothetical protein